MNRKIFAILFVSLFLIASIGFACAANESDVQDTVKDSVPIKVKIAWNDNGQTSDRPGHVTVNLIRDGKVVESVKLSESNSWSATFKTQNDGGNYKVSLASGLSDYSVSTGGNAKSGFVITGTLKEAPEASKDVAPAVDAVNDTSNATDITAGNSTDDNSTDNDTSNDTDKNSTDKKDVPKKDTPKKDTKTVKKTKTKVTKAKLKKTGIPIVALTLVAMCAVFVPFTRKK